MKSTTAIRNGTQKLNLGNSTQKKTAKKDSKKLKNIIKQKLYSKSGQAPAPSKDFFELVVYAEDIIWRKWRIRYTKNGRVIPSEEKYTIEKFLDSDVVQNDIERNLGEDVLHMAIGYLTNSWLPRLPLDILANITSNLYVKDICNLQKVCTTLQKRLRKDEIWKFHLFEDFGIDANLLKDNKKALRKCYIQETIKKKENEIDWENV